MKVEQWKPTQYKNYEVSNLGKVRNTKTGKILEGGISKSTGYYKVSLYVDKKVKTIEIHSLVCTAFHGNKPSKNYVVDHFDENKLNNTASNLHWITHSQNVKKVSRKASTQRRLSYKEYVQLREEYCSKPYNMASITAWVYQAFGLTFSRCNMSRILKGVTYSKFNSQYR